MLENMTTGEKALIGATAIGIAALVFHKPTRNAVGLSDGRKVIKNSTGSKAVRISKNQSGYIAMYYQIYNGHEQVLQSKTFASMKNAEKWANKTLNK